MKNYILYAFTSILLFSTSSRVLSNDEISFLCIADIGRFELYKNSDDYRLNIVSFDADLNLLAGICSNGEVTKTSYHRFKVIEHAVVCSNGNARVELYSYINEEGYPFKEQGVLIKSMDEPYICGEGSFSQINKIDDTK